MNGHRSRRDTSRKEEDSGAGQVITFLIAFAVFVPAFTLLIAFTRDSSDSTNARVADLDTKARLTLDQLVAEPGRPTDWEAGWAGGAIPAGLEKVGWREADRAALDYGKLRKIAGSALERDLDDDKLNYEECRDLLGLPARYGFHVRSYPVISANAGNRWGTDALPPVRVAYIGQWTPGRWDGVLQVPTGVESASSANERNALGALNILFTNVVYEPGNGILPEVEGDVYPAYNDPGQDDADGPAGDADPYLNKSLFVGADPRAEDYDVIIVGSDVDPEHFGAGIGSFQAQIEDWVQLGKLLVVLGTDNYEGDWLADVLGANPQGNTPGALTRPDDSHAFLTTPNRLDVPSYESALAADAWDLSQVTGFTRVVGDSEAATVLGLSNDGKYAEGGAVFVMAMQPGELADQDEAQRLLANALVYKFLRPAYIDYGPEMDAGALARSATRIVPIEMQSGSTVDAKVVLFMWRAG